MARFAAQLRTAQSAHAAVNSLEAVARDQIDQAFDAWDAGLYDARTVRYRLEQIVRQAYRSSVALAVAHVGRQTEDLVPNWRPTNRVFVTPYLTSLISDIRRNLREYKADGLTPEARRRAVLRMRHSAGVAVQRGYTDALISGYGEMADMGLVLKKVWVARPTACPECARLHGTEVGLTDEFPRGRLPVYIDLMGPPAHPHCQCQVVIFVVTLENAFDRVDLDEIPTPDRPQSMTAEAVRRMPSKIFTAFVTFVTSALDRLRRRR